MKFLAPIALTFFFTVVGVAALPAPRSDASIEGASVADYIKRGDESVDITFTISGYCKRSDVSVDQAFPLYCKRSDVSVDGAFPDYIKRSED